MSDRGWTDDAELLTQALEAGADAYRRGSGYLDPDENNVTVDGTYDATAVLNFIRAAVWDEGYEKGVSDQGIDERDTSLPGGPNTFNPYRS
jgi:hypothetical protein